MSKGRVEHLNPDGLARIPAFSQAVAVSGPVKTIYVGGQDAITTDGEIVGKGDIGAQTAKILENIGIALAAAGARPEHVIKLNILVVEGQDVVPGFEAFRRVWPNMPNPPVITVAFVKALGNPDWLAEIEAIAVVPDSEVDT